MNARLYDVPRSAGSAIAGALLLALLALPLGAQETDGRWHAFLGCWEPTGPEAEAGLLCIRPMNDGVEMSTLLAGEVADRQLLVANGERGTTDLDGCDGWERLDWSDDGRRLFTHSELTCGSTPMRTGTGVMSFVSAREWIDVRAWDVDGEQIAWVQRYRLVDPNELAIDGVADPAEGLGLAVRMARRSAYVAIDLDDVREAAGRVDAKTVEAWLAARGEPFDVRGDDLVALANAGVPESVIDVVVAVSYPEQFVIDPENTGDILADRADGDAPAYGRYGGYPFGVRSYLFDPFYFGGSYGYGGYGYGGYGYGTRGFRYAPTTVVIDHVGGGFRGRVLNHRGYTRGSRGSSGAARPSARGASRSSGASSSGGSRRARPAKSSGGRKAKRRGGG